MTEVWAELEPAWSQVGPTWANIFLQAPVWKPEPAVLINDVDFTGETIGQITIRRGRDSVYVEPAASYAAITLREVGGPLNLSIGDKVAVTLNTAFGIRETLFAGRISDVNVSAIRAQTIVGEFAITAVGALASANRSQVLAGGRSEELDGERALAAMLDAIAPTWEGQPVDLEWTDALGLYADYAGAVDLDNFDAGVFEVAELDPAAGGYAALQVAQEAAFSGGGVLYEDRFGRIGYADAARRANTLASSDFANIPADILDLTGFNASSSLSEVANRIVLNWDGGTVEADEPESQRRFGLFAQRVETILANEPDAQRRADELVQELSLPVFKADQFRLLLNNASPLLLERLVTVEPNDGVDFTGIPSVLGFTRLVAFVEGVEWRIDPFRVELGLFASDERLSVGGVWWGRVTPTLEWGDVDAALEWQDVERVL